MVRLKLKYSEIEVLQGFTVAFMEKRNNDIVHKKDLEAILFLDISKAIFLKLRNKLEQKKSEKPINLNLSPSQAVTMMKITQEIGKTTSELYANHVTTKTINQLHQELFNL